MDRETAGAKKRVQDTERAVRHLQEEMRTAERRDRQPESPTQHLKR